MPSCCVAPGTGWPGDLATAATPVAEDPGQVRDLAASAAALAELAARQSVCRACPRLVGWREQVATERRRSFADEQYWGRPVPGWGAVRPRVVIATLLKVATPLLAVVTFVVLPDVKAAAPSVTTRTSFSVTWPVTGLPFWSSRSTAKGARSAFIAALPGWVKNTNFAGFIARLKLRLKP